MRTTDDIMRDIVHRPECDDIRLEFANSIERMDSRWASYVRACMNPNSVTAEFLQPPEDIARRLLAPFRSFGEDVGVEFHRGFPTSLYITTSVFLEHGVELLALAPFLEVHLGLERSVEQWDPRTWNEYLPELMQCPALALVRELGFSDRRFDLVSMKHIITSPYLDRLLVLRPPGIDMNSPNVREEEEEMWALLLESPVFRRMIDWGLREEEGGRSLYDPKSTRLVTERQLGDRMVMQPYGTSGVLTHFEPMSEESRALEQKYGYIPYLHAGNWNATVLDVLRGKKPDFPAGATPTEAMYAVPSPIDRLDTGY